MDFGAASSSSASVRLTPATFAVAHPGRSRTLAENLNHIPLTDRADATHSLSGPIAAIGRTVGFWGNGAPVGAWVVGMSVSIGEPAGVVFCEEDGFEVATFRNGYDVLECLSGTEEAKRHAYH